MSITSYFTLRNTKATNSDLTPACSPLHLESLELTTTISTTQPTPLLNKDKDNLCLSRSQTLPIGLADMVEEEEQQEKTEPKPPAAPKKQERSQETELTLLITPMNLMPHFHPEQPLLTQTMMFLWTLCELCEMRQKAKERKEHLQQFLLQRNSRQQTHIILVVVGPFSSTAFITTTPRTYHKEQPSSSRSGFHVPQRRKTWGKSFKCSTW